jgi:TDG/mug DNA glycosylase family protein
VRKSGLSPVLNANTEILILGSLPNDTSLSTGQYYADRRSDFWKLVGAALNQSVLGLSYADKLELLRAYRIGLWYAYHACFRLGSMDKVITEKEPNDFTILQSIAPNIWFICLDGQEAGEAEDSLVRLGYQTRVLPSSGGANRRDQKGRLDRWKLCLVFD